MKIRIFGRVKRLRKENETLFHQKSHCLRNLRAAVKRVAHLDNKVDELEYELKRKSLGLPLVVQDTAEIEEGMRLAELSNGFKLTPNQRRLLIAAMVKAVNEQKIE